MLFGNTAVTRWRGGAILLRYFVVLLLLLASSATALAEGLSGWTNFNRNSTQQFENNRKTGSTDTFNRNFYINLDKSITPVLSYQLYLRANMADSNSTGADGNLTSVYQRSAEPAVDFFLRNPMYTLDAGYRRHEVWSAAHLNDKNRTTTDFYYSRLNILTYEFPTLLLQYERQKDYDYLTPRNVDTTSDKYSASSGYRFAYKGIDTSMNAYYSRAITETPMASTTKTISDSFSGLYNIGYSRSVKDGLAVVSAIYQGNYAQNRTQQFASHTGSNVLKRLLQTGLRAVGTAMQPAVDVLNSDLALIDTNLTDGIAALNIGQNGTNFTNIGVQLFTERSVDRLFVYVNKNVSADADLSNIINWKAYMSNSNIAGTWSEVSIKSVTISAYDPINNIYRYEIDFNSAQSALFFKLVTLKTITGINDVLVTEIEAYGTDIIPDTGKISDVSTLFNQGLNLNVNIRATSKLNFALNYLINRADNNPASVFSSISGIASDIFTKNTNGAVGDTSKVNITKTYGATSTWMVHRLLTATARIQRNEAYDNKKETDVSSNIYSVALGSAPLPTVSTTLTLIKNDNFNFSAMQSTSKSTLLNVGTKLYRDINMMTDIGLEQTKNLTDGTTSSSQYIRGTIDAPLTPKLFTNFTYGLSNTKSAGTKTTTKEGGTIISYRPSRLVNLAGTFRISDTDGNAATTESLMIDWLPLPVVKLNLNYQHTQTSPGPSISDTLGSYTIWYITKFLDLQLSYSYTQSETDKKSKSYNLGLNLNCRFWQ